DRPDRVAARGVAGAALGAGSVRGSGRVAGRPRSGPPRRRRAAASPAGHRGVSERDPSTTTPAPISTRRYGWAVGILALALVIGFVLYTLSSHKPGSEGVPAGGALHLFAAPLAASTLNGDANLNPPCTLAHHDPRALNICLLVKRRPLVLGFFVTSSTQCERE